MSTLDPRSIPAFGREAAAGDESAATNAKVVGDGATTTPAEARAAQQSSQQQQQQQIQHHHQQKQQQTGMVDAKAVYQTQPAPRFEEQRSEGTGNKEAGNSRRDGEMGEDSHLGDQTLDHPPWSRREDEAITRMVSLCSAAIQHILLDYHVRVRVRAICATSNTRCTLFHEAFVAD